MRCVQRYTTVSASSNLVTTHCGGQNKGAIHAIVRVVQAMSGQVSVEWSHFSQRPDLLVCLQRECSCLLDTLELLYADKPALTRIEVGDLYASLRHGGVSIRQLNAAIGKVCGGSRDLDSGITKHELSLLLPELDRRYFIIQGARWEFALLDRNRKGEITEKDALFLFRSVHGRHFIMHSWDTFLKERADRRSKVTWKEIEVPLCDIPDELGNSFVCLSL